MGGGVKHLGAGRKAWGVKGGGRNGRFFALILQTLNSIEHIFGLEDLLDSHEATNDFTEGLSQDTLT